MTFEEDFPSFKKVKLNNMAEKYIKEEMQKHCRDVDKIKKAVDKAVAWAQYPNVIKNEIYKRLKLK